MERLTSRGTLRGVCTSPAPSSPRSSSPSGSAAIGSRSRPACPEALNPPPSPLTRPRPPPPPISTAQNPPPPAGPRTAAGSGAGDLRFVSHEPSKAERSERRDAIDEGKHVGDFAQRASANAEVQPIAERTKRHVDLDDDVELGLGRCGGTRER